MAGVNEETLYLLRETDLKRRMDAVYRAYSKLPPEQKAYVDEALDRIMTHVKSTSLAECGYEFRFGEAQAFEVLGLVMMHVMAIEQKKSPGKVPGDNGKAG